MRKFFLFFITTFVFVATSVSAQTRRVTIELPGFSRLFGLGPRTAVAITNGTQFSAQLIVAGQEVASCVLSGASRWSRRAWEFERADLPVVARFYTSPDCTGDPVGITGRVLQVIGGQATTWTINATDIQFLDGRMGVTFHSTYPTAEVGANAEVRLPRLSRESETAVQFVNATLFEARVRVNGQEAAAIAPGGVYTAVTRYFQAYPATVTFQVVFADRGRFVGSYETQTTVSDNRGQGPRAYQHIMTPYAIRRQF